MLKFCYGKNIDIGVATEFELHPLESELIQYHSSQQEVDKVVGVEPTTSSTVFLFHFNSLV